MGLWNRIQAEVRAAGWGFFLEVTTAPIQVIALIVVRLIRPIIHFRIGRIIAPRIGHMATNTDLALSRLSLNKVESAPHTCVFWYPSEKVCNKFLLKLIRRRTVVFPRWAIIVLVRLNDLIPGGFIHDFDSDTDRDITNLLDKSRPQFQLTSAEISRGFRIMENYGVPHESKFVLLNVRDSAYLQEFFPDKDWKHHDYRDCSVENYILAADELTRRGYYVFRMGVVVERPLDTLNPMIIDYASNGMRSDFMDIFLASNCEFCISQGTGFDAVPFVFRRPILYVNLVPISHLPTFSQRFLMRTKNFVWTESGEALTLREIFDAGVAYGLTTKTFSDARVSLVENSPQEILDAVTEMVDRLEGKWVDTPTTIALQQKFWATYASCLTPDGLKLHGEFRAHYVTSVLEKDPGWLD